MIDYIGWYVLSAIACFTAAVIEIVLSTTHEPKITGTLAAVWFSPVLLGIRFVRKIGTYFLQLKLFDHAWEKAMRFAQWCLEE